MADLPEWRAFIAERDRSRRNQLLLELLPKVSAEAAGELSELLRSRDDAELEAGLRAVVALLHTDHHLEDDVKHSISANLASVAKAQYPRVPIGTLAFEGWRRIDSPAADQFLLEALDVQRLSGKDLEIVVDDLWAAGAVRSLPHLEKIALRKDALGTKVQATLESRGLTVNWDRIHQLAEEWRATKAAAALSGLYHYYIAPLDVGRIPLEDIIKLLGPPTDRHEQQVWYHATPGTSLYLDADSHGFLRGRKLT